MNEEWRVTTNKIGSTGTWIHFLFENRLFPIRRGTSLRPEEVSPVLQGILVPQSFSSVYEKQFPVPERLCRSQNLDFKSVIENIFYFKYIWKLPKTVCPRYLSSYSLRTKQNKKEQRKQTGLSVFSALNAPGSNRSTTSRYAPRRHTARTQFSVLLPCRIFPRKMKLPYCCWHLWCPGRIHTCGGRL